jgi:hypothetical protein
MIRMIRSALRALTCPRSIARSSGTSAPGSGRKLRRSSLPGTSAFSSLRCCSSSLTGLCVTSGRLSAALEEFVGHPAFNTGQLREDLNRFIFLLGGSEDEALFGSMH